MDSLVVVVVVSTCILRPIGAIFTFVKLVLNYNAPHKKKSSGDWKRIPYNASRTVRCRRLTTGCILQHPPGTVRRQEMYVQEREALDNHQKIGTFSPHQPLQTLK